MNLSMKMIAVIVASSSVFASPVVAGVMMDFMPRYQFAEPKPVVAKDKTVLSETCELSTSSSQKDVKNCSLDHEPVAETLPTKVSN